MLPDKSVTELTDWAVEVTEVGITEPRVVLRVIDFFVETIKSKM